MRHRPFFVEGDSPIVNNKKLLNLVIKSFELLELYQPFGAISCLGVQESIKILNHYKKDIEKAYKDKKISDALRTETFIVQIPRSENDDLGLNTM